MMREISVTEFKNKALKLLDEVSRTGRKLLLTRHGKPLARVEPARRSEKIVLGRMAGAMKLVDDIVQPLGPDDWDACQ